MPAESRDGTVGYKRPPSRTRFKRGQSGNPSGRPKRRPTFHATLLAELAAAMPGKNPHRGASKLQALVRTLINTAIAGDARAQALLVSTLVRVGSVEDNEPNLLTQDDRAILDAYVGDELKRRINEPETPSSADKPEED
jgi:hypothetical protein